MARGKDERARLLTLAGDEMLRSGISGMSLSGLARSVGSNNRMLLYYFGSKEALLTEAGNEIALRFPHMQNVADALADRGPIDERLHSAWLELRHPDNLPYLRLVFETFGVAAHSPKTYPELLTATIGVLPTLVANAFRAEWGDGAGILQGAAEIVALWRGLQLGLILGEQTDVLDRASLAMTQDVVVRCGGDLVSQAGS